MEIVMLNQRVEDGILFCEFDNGKTNTLTYETLELLDSAVNKTKKESSLKGIILTGSGRTFSAGFDLSIFTGFKDHNEAISFFQKEEEVLQNLFMCNKPVVSAINGHAIAGGLILALASDYRIAKNHPKIKLSMSEIKLGISLTITMSEVVKFGLDSNRAYRDVVYSGDIFDVNRGVEIGFIDELAEEEELLPRAIEVVNTWSANPGTAFSGLKMRLREPVYEGIKKGMKDGRWKDGLKVFFDEDARKAMTLIHSLMENG
jgi:enoyl-CoA hydratase/carnithine racemase